MPAIDQAHLAKDLFELIHAFTNTSGSLPKPLQEDIANTLLGLANNSKVAAGGKVHATCALGIAVEKKLITTLPDNTAFVLLREISATNAASDVVDTITCLLCITLETKLLNSMPNETPYILQSIMHDDSAIPEVRENAARALISAIKQNLIREMKLQTQIKSFGFFSPNDKVSVVERVAIAQKTI